MDSIRKAMLMILLPALLLGAQVVGDTLWVARVNPPDRTAQIVFKRPFSVTYSPDGERFTLTCAAMVRDSGGALVTRASEPRWIGVLDSTHQIVYTTVDTIPTGWKPGEWTLDAEGKFTQP